MDKIKFFDEDSNSEIEFFVLEQTTINGNNYILVTEEEEGDCDCFILKEVSDTDGEVKYEDISDDNELEAIGRVFAELLEEEDVGLEGV
ncbi:MAG: DUF1292 domain-containing protein [Lachnospiraceae bacterium]|nr:DUF1292 domain-containing protein [Lachnospiraceae bacterium]